MTTAPQREELTNRGKPHVCGEIAVHNGTRDGISLCYNCKMPVDTKREEEWEKEFDAEYGTDNMDLWSLGIVAQTLVHARTAESGADASYLTKKLIKLIKSEKEKFRTELLDGLAKGVEILRQAEHGGYTCVRHVNETVDAVLALIESAKKKI